MLTLMITPMITGSISFVSSLTIIVMILKSNLKLTTVYRRLIFGISVFDLIQSLSQALSSVPMPAGSWVGAMGNDVTCDLQGLMASIGSNGSLLYSMSLSIYFLAMIRNQTTERMIREKLERRLHAVPILFVIVASAALLATNSFNPKGSICTTALEPMYCEFDPDIECKDLKLRSIVIYVFVACPLFVTFVGNVVIMCLLWRTEYLMAKKNQYYRSGWLTSGGGGGEGRNDTATSGTLSPLAARLSRPSLASMRRRKEIARRGTAYIICTLLTYIFAILVRMIPTVIHHLHLNCCGRFSIHCRAY